VSANAGFNGDSCDRKFSTAGSSATAKVIRTQSTVQGGRSMGRRDGWTVVMLAIVAVGIVTEDGNGTIWRVSHKAIGSVTP
jgi:hypothetical protein